MSRTFRASKKKPSPGGKGKRRAKNEKRDEAMSVREIRRAAGLPERDQDRR